MSPKRLETFSKRTSGSFIGSGEGTRASSLFHFGRSTYAYGEHSLNDQAGMCGVSAFRVVPQARGDQMTTGVGQPRASLHS
jgi:hypothetical protein